MKREALSRLVVLGALGIVVIVLGYLLLGGSSGHIVYAEFTDAGQLVGGDLVSVGGHQVGSVGGITLAQNGAARVELDISDDSVWPLREGTRAQIRQISLTGVANRFVGLTPASSGPSLGDHGIIAAQYTRGIVDLDILLDALNPKVRSSLRQIIKTGAYTFSGSTPGAVNSLSHVLSPALSQMAAFGREVVSDRFALDRLVASTAQVSSALAARTSDLSGAVSQTAGWLKEVATQRTALQDSLVRAPGVLSQARGVLGDVSYSLGTLNPVLTDLRPVAPRLADLLVSLRPTVRGLVPTISGINSLVGRAESSLSAFSPVAVKAVPSVRSLTSALTGITPILSGLRPYLPDQVAGFFEAIGGSVGQDYDANGHYGRIEPVLSGSGTSLNGALGLLGGLQGAISPLKAQSGLLSACPGGGAPPSQDGSSPFVNNDAAKKVQPLCNPAQDQQ